MLVFSVLKVQISWFLFCVTSKEEMIILESYTMTESTIQRIAAKGRKRAPESQFQVLKDVPFSLLSRSLSLSFSVKLSLPCLAASLQDGAVAKGS